MTYCANSVQADRTRSDVTGLAGMVHADHPFGEEIADSEHEGQDTDTQAHLPAVDDALSWEDFPRSDPLKTWAYELGHACDTQGDLETWGMVGKAALIVSDSMNYCREALHRVATDAGMHFLSIPAVEVIELPSPEAFQQHAPLLIYLEPGQWLLDQEDNDDAEVAETIERFQDQLSEWIAEFNPAYPVVYATSADSICRMTERLRQVGLFDRFLQLPAQTLEARGEGFIDWLGRPLCGESILNSAGKVGKFLALEFDGSERREQLAILRLQRLHAATNRPLEFLDLVNLATHGLVEEGAPPPDGQEARWYTAYHEAGHAAMTVIDSNGENIPDYASIVPTAHFRGIVVESYGYRYERGDRSTYLDFRQDIRIGLAGRAAEEVVFGAERVSRGASNDLENATRRASEAFAYWGYSPSMGEAGQSASNLAVIVAEPSISESKHLESLVREFLSIEYTAVKKMLTENRCFLDEIAKRLMQVPILDQNELAELSRQHLQVDRTASQGLVALMLGGTRLLCKRIWRAFRSILLSLRSAAQAKTA